jgi:hypothetical protein
MDVDKCIYSDDAVLPAYGFTFLEDKYFNQFSFLLDGKSLEIFQVWNYVYRIDVFFK